MNDVSALAKTYDPHAIEQALYTHWEQAGCFAPSGDGEPFCIMIPPPNVTGSLHMGHAFQDTIMDALTRYHRMRGHRTLWQAGTDHAGIATQMVVERQLEVEGKSRHDLGRDAFIRRVWEWKAQSGGTITQQLRRMGASLDWSRERFTMDEGLSNAVQEVFVQLFEEGLIYRGKRLVNWDPVLHTAVSDLEVIASEESGHLWHIRYPLADGGGHLTVATTRPETMLGDAAVAVHPDDTRYRHLTGKCVRLPLAERDIPIIADEYVDPEFGSGCVKITPAHDFNDYEVGQRHDLPLLNIMTDDAAIDLPGSVYHGLDRYAARKRIVSDLDAQGLLQDTLAHTLVVPRGDRSNAVIEPYLTKQWYVAVESLAKAAITAVEDGSIRFVPENWDKTYYEWMHNIQDWCISRQIWWGHRIPAWYDTEGNIYVARNEADAQQQAQQRHGKTVVLTQDEDVLDTWFSSALWPFSTLGWPQQSAELQTFYPTSVLVTGFDIIFFWVARMIMFGLKFTGKPPFTEVYVHGLVRDADGQKMSKSKGNILDPLDLIDGITLQTLLDKRTTGLMQPHLAPRIEASTRKQFPDGIPAYGTDALRFTFASLATQGRDIRFDLGRIDGYRNFCNKLWNASRFVLMNTASHDLGTSADDPEIGVAERWITARLHQTTQQVTDAVRDYRLDRMAQALYGFVWDEYCSWYLEMAKISLADERLAATRHAATRRTLLEVLEASLRLLHPLMPFITETLWQRVAPLTGCDDDTVMTQPYPLADIACIDTDAIQEIEWLQLMVTGIRNIRGERNIEPGKRLPILLHGASERDLTRLERHRQQIAALARVSQIDVLDVSATIPQDCAISLVGDMKVLLPLEAIDKPAELARIQKTLDKLEKDILKSGRKLDNQDFIARAPASVVEKERQRLTEFESSRDTLQHQLEQVDSLPN